jgi:chromosome segregation ATPase
MLGIGAIASVIHFIIAPENQELILVLKGSLIPFLVALMLFIVMNIMHQTQVAENERIRANFTQALIEQITKQKEFIANLERRMVEYAKEEKELRDEFIFKFNKDIETLSVILDNQQKFMDKFEELRKWHTELTELFINFTEFKLPELDKIIHKHIDMLRISEAEHYEKVHKFLKDTLGDKEDIKKEFEELKNSISSIKTISNDISNKIYKETLAKMSNIYQSFEKEMITLTSQTQSFKTSLNEGEAKIEGIKQSSEYVIEQMVLLSKKVEEFEGKKEIFDNIATKIYPILSEIEKIQKEYIIAVGSLKDTADEIRNNEEKYISELASRLEESLKRLDEKVDESLEEIKEKYVVATDNITDSVKILAKKAQLSKAGYAQNDE